jgi:hypothetical protein
MAAVDLDTWFTKVVPPLTFQELDELMNILHAPSGR